MDDRRAAGPGRAAARVLASLLLAIAALVVPASAGPALAADDGLRLEVATTYSLDPAAGVLRGRLDVVATNEKRDRVSGNVVTSYYFDELRFPLPQGSDHIRAAAGGAPLDVRTAEADDGFIETSILLRSRLRYRQTAHVRIEFDQRGGEPRSGGLVRVGRAFSTFDTWAYGDAGLASVRVVTPAGLTIETDGSTLRRLSGGGETVVHEATAIADPAAWWALVTVSSEANLTRRDLDLDDRLVTVRAWPEDPEWLGEVGDVLTEGIPALDALIGLAWPVDGRLNVVEVHTPLLEGYAGLYYTDLDRIEISEDLDALTIVHEASHAWFNEHLFTERWINEGLADEYAARVLATLDRGEPGPLRPFPDGTGGIALNQWSYPGRIDDAATDQREAYGYNASWWLLRALVDEVGEAGMRDVFRATVDDRIAYRGAGFIEQLASRDDWRGFLDRLEETAGSERAEALFRELVVSERQRPLLDERAAARAAYEDLLEAGDGWKAPLVVRRPMAQWTFDDAATQIDAALAVLRLRDEAVDVASQLDVSLGPQLRRRYEAAEESFDAVRAYATTQRDAIAAVARADAAVQGNRDVFATLGLLGAAPAAGVSDAKRALERGDLSAAVEDVRETEALLDGAGSVGRERAVATGGATGGLAVGAAALLLVRRRRRGVGPRAYATLAATPREAPPEPTGDPEA